MKGISIIICCYNSSERLPATIQYIAGQKIDPSISWELIIVDNNSTDNTYVAAKIEISQYPSIQKYKIIRQEIPGLSAAREKGIESSDYDYIIFCDDDNWLDENFVSNGYKLIYSNPEIGIIGSFGEPVFEIPPPSWINDKQLLRAYAVGKQAESQGDITKLRGFVYGAATVLNKRALFKINSNGYKGILSGRKGSNLTAGEDSELCHALNLAGYKIWYSEDLIFKHFIAKRRLTWNYCIKVYEGFGKATPYLKIYENMIKEGKKDKILIFQFLQSLKLWFRLFKENSLEIDVLQRTLSISHNNKAQMEGEVLYLYLSFAQEEKKTLLRLLPAFPFFYIKINNFIKRINRK